MHQVKNLFLLATNLNTDLFLADPGKFIRDDSEGFLGFCGIDDHHHVEIAFHDGLGDVKDIDLVLRKVCADACDDADGIFSYNSDDSSFHFLNPFVKNCVDDSISELDQCGRGAALRDTDGQFFGPVVRIGKHDFHAHGLESEFRKVVFLAEVAQEDAFEVVVEDLAQKLAAAGVGEVAPLAQDALFESVGVAANLEQIDIVIGLQQQDIRVFEAFPGIIRVAAEIRADAGFLAPS